MGPLTARGPNRHRKQQTGFARVDFGIDFDHRTVTCPNGKVTSNWVQAPAMAPYLVARFHKNHCSPCPDRSRCTSGTSPRTISFLPRHLHQIQAKNRTDQHDPTWLRLYHSRSGVEGTVNDIVNGHRMRRYRSHGTTKVHLQLIMGLSAGRVGFSPDFRNFGIDPDKRHEIFDAKFDLLLRAQKHRPDDPPLVPGIPGDAGELTRSNSYTTSVDATQDSQRRDSGPGRGPSTGVRLYTPSEAAAMLQVRESWLRKKASARVIPCTFIGKHLRFSERDIAAIIAAGAKQPVVRRRGRH